MRCMPSIAPEYILRALLLQVIGLDIPDPDWMLVFGQNRGLPRVLLMLGC